MTKNTAFARMLAVAYSIQTGRLTLFPSAFSIRLSLKIAGDPVEDNFSGLIAVHSAACAAVEKRPWATKNVSTRSVFSKGQRGFA
jgi:hypothetical protein